MAFDYTNNIHTQDPGKQDFGCTVPYSQFMGADIKGFNIRLGLGSQESEMTLDLVESVAPPGPGATGYGTAVPAYTAIDNFHRSVNQGCLIPGYSGVLGQPYSLTFVVDNNTLKFTGILQDHDIKIDSNGKTISARLTDGRQFLNNVSIIANKYYSRNNIYDNTGSSKNIINILWEAEKGVSAQFDYLNATGFAKCDYFMDTGADKDGIPAIFILGQFMTSRYLSLPLSTKTIKIVIDEVYNMVNTKAKYLRIPDTSLSLLSLIETACNEAGHDFYVYMDYVDDGYVMYVKTIDKSTGLSSFSLRDYIRNNFYINTATDTGNSTLSVTYGQEATYENTRNIIFGNNYRYFIEITYDLQSQVFNAGWNAGFLTQSSSSIYPAPYNPRTILTDQYEPIRTLEDNVTTQVFNSGNTGSFVPSLPGCTTCAPSNGGGRIAMVLGEKLNMPFAPNAQGVPTHRMYVSNLTNDSIDIEYDISELCNMLGVSCPGATARLTQDELLFSETYEAYFNWSLAHPGSIGYIFGSAIFGALWSDLQRNSLKIFADIVDNGSFDSFKDPATAYPDARIGSKQFEVVHQYIKEIYNNYYGKEYVVLLDRNIANSLSRYDICLGASYNVWPAGANGQLPQTSASQISIPTVNTSADLINNGVIKYGIKTSGRNGYIAASDYIVNGAWFAGPSISTVLGIDATNGLSVFLNDDNTIGGFVKYGPYKDICKKIGGKVFAFRVDFSELDINDYVIYNNELYLRADFQEEIFFAGFDNSITDNAWVRFSIPRVKLIPNDCTTGAIGIAASRLALIALSVMTDLASLSGVTDGTITLEQAIRDKLAGGGINPGVWDGISSNLSATNLAKISTPAIVPRSVAIPMESATMIYGPWNYSTNPNGGTQIVEHDLNPWSFGIGQTAHIDGWTSMITAGAALATHNAKGRTYQEKASISFVGLPDMVVGANPGGYAGIEKAFLSDISVSYGSNGTVTSINYQTYSPKFGSMPQYILNASKEIVNNKLQYLKQFREKDKSNRATAIKLREEIGKLSAGLGGGPRNIENSDSNASNYGHTPTKMLMGGYLNKNTIDDITNSDGGNATDSTTSITHNYTEDSCQDIDTEPFPVSAPSISNQGNILKRFVSAELHPSYNFDYAQKEYYKNMSYMSLDGLFLPISIDGGPNNNLVRYSTYTAETAEGILPKDRPIHAMPPVSYANTDSEGELGSGGTTFDLRINQKYLNPIVSENILNSWGTRKNDSIDGFVIINIAHGSTVDENFNFDEIKNIDGSTFKNRQQSTDFRFHALRGPLVLQSWGYDINGKPIPNSNDSATEAENGNFRNVNLQDKFLKNWLSNPKTWPVGPIDLRWDRHRGVWVSPPSSKLIVARMKTTLNPYGTAEAELLNPISGGKEYYQDYALYGENGENLKSDVRACTVTVHEYLGSTVPKCAMVLLHYEDGKYIVINETSNLLQRARIGTGQTLTCNGKCRGELFIIPDGGGFEYGEPNSIEIIDTIGIVPQALSSQTRLWVTKPPDSPSYEVVYIGNRDDANCGSCGGFGVYSIAGVDFNRLPTVTTVGSVLTVTDGGCLALVGTADCRNITTA